VTDYGTLAEKLKKNEGRATGPWDKKPGGNGNQSAAFYQSVKETTVTEIEKANTELRKRNLPVIERVFVPVFHGRFAMTFGPNLLCCVDMEEAKQRIIAVLFGPPHRCEISRKEFFLCAPQEDWYTASADEAAKTAIGYGPDRIAHEIVCGILEGEFS
jgi:hypothetical protein